MRSSKPESIDAYLAALCADNRAALSKLRKAITAAAPGAEECISYGIPAFRWHGRVIVFFHAATHHCSFFPGAHPIAAHAAELADYHTSKGTVRFSPDEPLPAALVRKLVKARMAEFAAKGAVKKGAKRTARKPSPKPAGRVRAK
jgi:uncharacterized protein YdhG (YjbR/CyaY superfamily)